MALQAFSSTARQLKQLNWTLHGSVILLDKDGKRITSAHAYINGYVKFSKEATFKPVKLPPMPGAPVIPLRASRLASLV